jgi:prolipoprotein diacylglyceryl transferase
VRVYIPSPSEGVVHLGPFPLRAYAGCILLGALAAVIIGDHRWVARGGRKGFIADMAATAVPTGLVGARLYHVVTDPTTYIHHPIQALYVWQGGLGIWGAILGGVLGAWYVARKNDVPMLALMDAVAPALPVAQAIGRFGNYFNQELYGRASTLPWALEIDPAHRPDTTSQLGTYQPTFLYEVIWDLGVAGVVLWADRRWQLGKGRAFALYVATYCVGRGWIEALRVDTANRFFGIRLNDYVATICFLVAVAYLIRKRGSGPDVLPVAVEVPEEALVAASTQRSEPPIAVTYTPVEPPVVAEPTSEPPVSLDKPDGPMSP